MAREKTVRRPRLGREGFTANRAFQCEVCGDLFDHQIAAIGHERAKHGMHKAEHDLTKYGEEHAKRMSGIACPICGSNSHSRRGCPQRRY